MLTFSAARLGALALALSLPAVALAQEATVAPPAPREATLRSLTAHNASLYPDPRYAELDAILQVARNRRLYGVGLVVAGVLSSGGGSSLALTTQDCIDDSCDQGGNDVLGYMMMAAGWTAIGFGISMIANPLTHKRAQLYTDTFYEGSASLTPELELTPYVSFDSAGLGVTIRF